MSAEDEKNLRVYHRMIAAQKLQTAQSRPADDPGEAQVRPEKTAAKRLPLGTVATDATVAAVRLKFPGERVFGPKGPPLIIGSEE